MGSTRRRLAPSSPKPTVKIASGPSVVRGNIRAVVDLAKVLRTTLGPLGMEKMIVSKKTRQAIVTDDGQLILRGVNIRHGAAKVVAALGEAQARENGDGVATAVLLVGELLRRAENLVLQGVPQLSIAEGYGLASEKVLGWIEERRTPMSLDSPGMRDVVRTALSGKAPREWEEAFTEATLAAARQVAQERNGKVTFNPANVLLDVQPDVTLEPIQVLSGLLVRATRFHPAMPARLRDAKVLLFQGLLDVPRPRLRAELVLRSPGQIQAVRDHRAGQLSRLADDLLAVGAKVIVCDGWAPSELGEPLAERGILLLQQVDRKILGKLAKATGGNVVLQYVGAKPEDLGRAGRVEECRVGRGRGTQFAECEATKVVTLLLGRHLPSSLPVLDRALHNALWAVKAALEGGAVPGGGALEVSLARRLREYAPEVSGKAQLSLYAFADALEGVPTALAEGMGADALDVLMHVRAAQRTKDDGGSQGVDVARRQVASMRQAGVLDATLVKVALIRRAAETAVLILRVDGAIPTRRRVSEMKDTSIQTPYPRWMRTEEDVHALAEHEVKMPLFRNMRSRIPQVKLEDIAERQ